MTLDKVHYTAKTRTTGGRDGASYSRATRGNIDVTITVV